MANDPPADLRPRDVELDDDSWASFVDLLGQPARQDPALTELFARPERITR